MHRKYKSTIKFNHIQVLPSFRTVGCKPCDFHRLKYGTSYNGFPKIRSSMDEYEKKDLNLNLKQEVVQKKKAPPIQRKKIEITVDKWKQRYGHIAIKEEDKYMQMINQYTHTEQWKKTLPNRKSLDELKTINIAFLNRKESQKKINLAKQSFTKETMITGNSLGMEIREQTKPMIDMKYKPSLGIKFVPKINKSDTMKKKYVETELQRWQVPNDDTQYINA